MTKLDLDQLERYPLDARNSLVHRESFGTLLEPSAAHWELIAAMPDFLGARSFRSLVEGVHRAWRANALVGMSIGAHVLKVGLGPTLVDLMERGILKAVAMHGAGAIHDFELAFQGATSEDVKTSLDDGSFGMAQETAREFAAACSAAQRSGEGLGRAWGRRMLELPYAKESVNVGSAVVLPEVFLKALTISRNLSGGPRNFLAANLDMIRHYRPRVNVLDRPTGGKGLDISGHHEMLLPLLRLGVLGKEAAG
jgi:hypothetical protein